MDPMTPERYRAWIQDAAVISQQWQAENTAMTREQVVNELHECLNAPDSFFNWHDGDERTTETIALDVLRFSGNRHAAVQDGRPIAGIIGRDEVNYEYLAAHAFVADVLDVLDRRAILDATPDLNDRDAIIAWLLANDPNGCHSDEDTLEEVGQIHTLESARACYRDQMGLSDDEGPGGTAELPDGLITCLHCGTVRDDDDAPCASCGDTGEVEDDEGTALAPDQTTR